MAGFDEAVTEQFQRPATASRGRSAARHGNQKAVALRVELWLRAGPGRFLQRICQSFQDKSLAGALHRADARLQGTGNRRVLFTRVRQK